MVAVAAGALAGLGAVRVTDVRTLARVTPVPAAELTAVPGQIIVQFRSGADEVMAERAIREAGGAHARRSAFGLRYLTTVAAGLSVEDCIALLEAMPEVEFAERNGRVWAHRPPNDDLYRFQWNMRLLDAERVWEIQTGDPSVVIAVLDTGIAYEDFGPFRKAPDWGNTRFVGGLNVFTGDSHANDDNFHGTHVASVIAEATDNGVGVAGLAFECALMPVKVLDERGEGSFFGVAEGVDHAVSFVQEGVHPVKVINLSLGSSAESRTLALAIDRAHAAGIVVVASAGNDGNSPVTYPAALPNVIAVGAVDGRKQRAPYSSYGAALDVVAPGGDIERDDDGDGEIDGILQQSFDPLTVALEGRYDDFAYFFAEGTSQAAPHVAAIAALLVRQGITDPDAVKAVIEATAEDLGPEGRDDEYGHGLVRPAEALKGLGLN